MIKITKAIYEQAFTHAQGIFTWQIQCDDLWYEISPIAYPRVKDAQKF